MIELYSGTPGSGKSFHATQKIYYLLRAKKRVISNYDINLNACRQNFFQYWFSKLFRRDFNGSKKLGDFCYKNNSELTVGFLKEYARKNHNRRKEGQTTVVIDECGIIFNPRTFLQSDRLEWIEFFSLHRHYGYNFILISQTDRMIDRQIRGFLEYEHRHRKVNNFGVGGLILSLFCGSLFVDVKLWYGLREKVGADWIRYSRRISSLYDTMLDSSGEHSELAESDALPEAGEQEGGPAGVCASDSLRPGISLGTLSSSEKTV